MSVDKVTLCHFLEVPTVGRECMEAVWSMGRACRKCANAKCYRQGWTASQATADNKRLVRLKREGRTEIEQRPVKE